MRWLQKTPTVGDEVMFVVWDMSEQAAQRRYGNVVTTFSNLAKKNIDGGGRLKLMYTKPMRAWSDRTAACRSRHATYHYLRCAHVCE